MKSLCALLIGLLSFNLVQAKEGSFSVKQWTERNPSLAPLVSEWLRLETSLFDSSRSKDRTTMQKARELFAAGKMNESLALYNQIEKGSDYWLEAVEEKAWIFHREKEFDKALAQSKTLLSQAFVPVVGPEPFFLQSLTNLKICDYKAILETHQLFKNSQRQRIQDLKDLAQSGNNSALLSVITKADAFPLSFTSVGEESKSLPRQFYRDREFQKALLNYKLAEAAKNSSAQGLAMTRMQNRLKALAQAENEEIYKIVQKLNLIEVETIQRLHADRDLDQKSYQKGHFADTNSDQMIFPDDGHPWLDELDKYQVRVNSCPQNIRRKM
jgi:hypothetical protein